MPDFKLLIAQIVVIIIVTRLVGGIFRKFHQPRVVGEMIAGLMLGPSLLGWLAPNVFAALFPPASLGALSVLSQIGLLLFMFLIGLELDWQHVRDLGRAAAITSLASIVIPFGLGCLLATFLYPRFSNASVNFTAFVLFIGTAISITAFPVLARILTEKDLLHTRVGALTITCAAVNDTLAWCLLAAIIVLVRANSLSLPTWAVLLGLSVYALVMLLVVKRGLQKLAAFYERRNQLTHDMLTVILLVVLASGWVTETLGVHALFGAFLTGLVMPRHAQLSEALWLRIEALIVVLFLPLYFVLTGLRSSLFLLSGMSAWWMLTLVLVTAIAGKLGGSMLAAKFGGLPWREAAAVGVLMNTRGMVELVILNIGLDLGIISPALFAIMVLMALVTTLMAAPLLSLVYRNDSSAVTSHVK